MAANFYPATASWAPGNNTEFYHLLANLVDPALNVPEPSSLALVLALWRACCLRAARGVGETVRNRKQAELKPAS